MKLRRILVAEGAAKTFEDLPRDVVGAASSIGYLNGTRLVITQYKAAAAKRHAVDGVNQNQESVRDFRLFSQRSRALGEDQTLGLVVRALLLHNAASALGRGNGNLPEEQAQLNEFALVLLEQVVGRARNDNWWTVFEKVYVGLVESGRISFDEETYRSVVASMARNGSKDTAGRREFLANWLVGQGRSDEAIEVLKPVEEDTFSAPNQRERAGVRLSQLRASSSNHVPVPDAPAVLRRPGGTPREHRARRPIKKGGTGSGGSEEPPHPIRLRVRCNTVSGTFISHQEGTMPLPPPVASSKEHQYIGAFLFVNFI